MKPKEQKIEYWLQSMDGSMTSFCGKQKKDGWFVHQITSITNSSAYVVFYKY